MSLAPFQTSRPHGERGITEVRRSLDSDPLSAYLTMTLGVSLFTAGRLEEAIDTCRRALQWDPESFVSRWARGIALGMAGRFDEAVSTLERREHTIWARIAVRLEIKIGHRSERIDA